MRLLIVVALVSLSSPLLAQESDLARARRLNEDPNRPRAERTYTINREGLARTPSSFIANLFLNGRPARPTRFAPTRSVRDPGRGPHRAPRKLHCPLEPPVRRTPRQVPRPAVFDRVTLFFRREKQDEQRRRDEQLFTPEPTFSARPSPRNVFPSPRNVFPSPRNVFPSPQNVFPSPRNVPRQPD